MSSATFNSRRGQVEGMEQRGSAQVITAKVPLAEMFGYVGDLRSRTQGRATYTMQFDSYQRYLTRSHKRSSLGCAASDPHRARSQPLQHSIFMFRIER